MKFPESKLNIGDTLYELNGKDIIEWRVHWISCFINKDPVKQISYGIRKVSTQYEKSIYESLVGTSYFTSKKEMFLHLFGDCLTEGLVVK